MNIEIYQCIEGARRAKGVVVIIDVFRAYTLECVLFSQNAKEIHPVGKLEQAFALKKKHPDWILFGERKGAMVQGCDYGNSPSSIAGMDFTDRTLIHSTSAGTQGIVNAVHADTILVASLANAKATAAWIRQNNPKLVSLVAMGDAGIRPTEEDYLCAQYIRSLLLTESYPIIEKTRALRNGAGAKFFDPSTQHIFPKEDFAYCIDINKYNFAILYDMKKHITIPKKMPL